MRRVCLIAGLFTATACSLNNPGAEPPSGKIYFPTAVAVADGHLLVASSNFDIRYNAGSLQAYNLSEISAAIEDPARCIRCLPSDPSCDIHRPCVIRDTRGVLASEVLIDSFATGITYSPATGRVYVPTRSNGGLTFVEFAEGTLGCAQGARRCGPANVAGVDPGELGLTMPTHPTSVATGAAADLGFLDETGMSLDGQYILVGDHDRAVSLFIDSVGGDSAPMLRHVRRGLPGEVTEIAVGDASAFLATLVETNASKKISQVGFDQPLDSEGRPRTDFLFSYIQADLSIGAFGGRSSIRSIAFVPGSTTELVAVTLSPNALVHLDLQRPRALPSELLVESVVSLGSGPSKVEVGQIGNDPRSFAFVSCFDSREIMVVDLTLQRLVSVIQGLTGPFSLALDTMHSRLYVGDFRSSTVRIVDLAPLVRPLSTDDIQNFEPNAPRVIAILGQPSEAQVLQ